MSARTRKKSAGASAETAHARRPLEGARADLVALKAALTRRGSDASGIAILARSVSDASGYHGYVRWLDLEISGYPEGPVIDLLDVFSGDGDSEILKRISSYRRQPGAVKIDTASRSLEPLPYSVFFGQPLAVLEQKAAVAMMHGPQQFSQPIPVSVIPQTPIREWLERFGVQVLPVLYDTSVFGRILAGFRAEIGRLVSELESALRFQEEIVSEKDRGPVGDSFVFNTNIYGGNVGGIANASGKDARISINQDATVTLRTLNQLFSEAFKDQESAHAAQPIKRFLEEATQRPKTPVEAKGVARTLDKTTQGKPALRRRIGQFAKDLPVKLAEHAVLGEVIHAIKLLVENMPW